MIMSRTGQKKAKDTTLEILNPGHKTVDTMQQVPEKFPCFRLSIKFLRDLESKYNLRKTFWPGVDLHWELFS